MTYARKSLLGMSIDSFIAGGATRSGSIGFFLGHASALMIVGRLLGTQVRRSALMQSGNMMVIGVSDMRGQLLLRLPAVLLVICSAACIANTLPADRTPATQQSRAAELYRETFGANTPEWGKLPEAFRLWTEQANAGDSSAMYYLSSVYFRGIPDVVEANNAMAIDLLKKAAKRRVPEALFALAWQHESGTHIQVDHREAVSLYQAAADSGSALAMSRLVRIYSNGELSQPVNEDRANVWRDRLQQLRKK